MTALRVKRKLEDADFVRFGFGLVQDRAKAACRKTVQPGDRVYFSKLKHPRAILRVQLIGSQAWLVVAVKGRPGVPDIWPATACVKAF